MKREGAPIITPGDVPSELAATLLRGRRSYDKYKPDPVPEAIVEAAVEVARWAPNHHLTEPWHFYLLGHESKEAIVELNAELVEADKGTEAAEAKRTKWSAVPGWLVVTCLRSVDPKTAREDYAACCCAVQNLMLYLWSEGVGSKWTTGKVTEDPGFPRIVGFDPEVEQPVALLWYGYPDQQARARRKPVEQILERRE